MIQGQFDAANKPNASKPQLSEGESDRDHAERPWKRRKSSPPVKDSIEVADSNTTGDTTSPNHHNTMKAAGPDEGKIIPTGGDSTKIANPDQASDSSSIEAKADAEDDSQQTMDPSEEEVVLLSGELTEAGGLPPSNVNVCNTSSKTGFEAPGPPNIPEDNKAHKDKPQQCVQVILKATLSRKSSRLNSPALGQAPASTISSSLSSHNKENASYLSIGPKQSQTLAAGQSNTLASGPSTPKSRLISGIQTNALSSPLSSPPPELFDPYDEQSTEPPPSSSRPSSPVSDNEEEDNSSDEGDSALSRQRVDRSQIFRRSLSNLKGRELFDASIWSDPLKTSVFYTFATNLRQKSRDASPTCCHHFISHLSNAGKMVRCYTQNIDLLEDKVGLSTRLLLGPGSRSRFSNRLSKAMAGTAILRNSNNNPSQPTLATSTPCTTDPIPPPSQDNVKDGGEHKAATLADTQETATSATKKDDMHNKYEDDTQQVAEGGSGQEQESGGGHTREQEQDDTINGTQSTNAASTSNGQPVSKPDSGPASPGRDRGVECVFLHGSLRSLRCFQCGCVADWDEADRELLTMSGEQPPCPRCEDATVARQERGKRALGVGKLRPDIVLYGEEHPESQRISNIIQHDISLAPDMLIIMGTSLRVHGLKTVVREFAKAVHNKKDGKVIFVNFTKPAESVWADIIDFWVEMDCDSWINDLKVKKPIIWLPPGSVDDEPRSTKRRRTIKDEAEKKEVKKSKKADEIKDVAVATPAPVKDKVKKPKKVEKESPEVKKPEPKRPAAFRDCKQNAAYWTAKIMSDLANLSGREQKSAVTRVPFQTITAPYKLPPAAVVRDIPVSQKPAISTTIPVKIRRGPRTKNIKSRNAPGKVSTTPKAGMRLPKALTKSAESELINATTSEQPSNQLSTSEFGIPGSAETPTDEDNLLSNVVNIKRSSSVEWQSVESSNNAILFEVSIPSSDPGSVSTGEGNSILAAVKSNHRIRKPKAIFGEPTSNLPSGQGTAPISSGINVKLKTKAAPQAKRLKLSVKPGKGRKIQGCEKTEDAINNDEGQMRTLPFPPRRPPISATLQPQSPHQSETPPESYTLPPLRHVNLEHYPMHHMSSVGFGPNPAPTMIRQPPDILEPIIIPGPPIAISPTALSPDHWRKRAFIYGDPILRHSDPIEPPRRPLEYMSQPSTGHAMPVYANAPGSFQPHPGTECRLAEAVPLFGGTPAVPDLSPRQMFFVMSDSPSQQLHRESRENEAAAALNDLRNQSGSNTRHPSTPKYGP